ncbi:MAG: hypothetical protein E6J43_12385 [Chloroflexi bacterium]|nr:MAG: hypothetical protein E6J43_12385 [Chloroflexota bacterium]
MNARVNVYAIMRDDPKAALAEAIKRGNAYAQAGADCIFYLGVSDRDTLATLVKEVAAPVSAFAVADTPSVAELQEIGVARVSYGSAFQRFALSALKRLAEGIREAGGHAAMREAMTSRELQEMLRGAAIIGRQSQRHLGVRALHDHPHADGYAARSRAAARPGVEFARAYRQPPQGRCAITLLHGIAAARR